MKCILEKSDVFRLLSQALKLELNDGNVRVEYLDNDNTFELHVSDVSPDVIFAAQEPQQTPAEKLNELLAEAVKTVSTETEEPMPKKDNKNKVEEVETPDDSMIIDGDTIPLDTRGLPVIDREWPYEKRLKVHQVRQEMENERAIQTLDDTNNEPASLTDLTKPKTPFDDGPAPRTKRKKYDAGPLPEALRASDYFGGEDPYGGETENPGPTTDEELRATRGNASAEQLRATERMIQNAK